MMFRLSTFQIWWPSRSWTKMESRWRDPCRNESQSSLTLSSTSQAIHCSKDIWAVISGRIWRKSRLHAEETFKCVSRVEFRCPRLTSASWLPTKKHTRYSQTSLARSARTCIPNSTSDTPTSLTRSSWDVSKTNWTKLSLLLRTCKACKYRCAATLEACRFLPWWQEKQSFRSKGELLRSWANSVGSTTRYLASKRNTKSGSKKLDWLWKGLCCTTRQE